MHDRPSSDQPFEDDTSPAEDATAPASNAGTVKSIERQRGTGSIAPDHGSHPNLDSGFTKEQVGEEQFEHLHIGERVHFAAKPSQDRPGYADATVVEVDDDETR
jgi:cold shock CspA family protein